MLKLLINAPKGGVGKTTIATNTALLLAEEGKSVLVLKLSGTSRIKYHIENAKKNVPNIYGKIEVEEHTDENLPNFKGRGKYDVVVADTDDNWNILDQLVDKKRKGWRVIVPIVPSDSEAMQSIPEELQPIVNQSRIIGINLCMKIVPNKCGLCDDSSSDISLVKQRLQDCGLLTYMSRYYLPYAGRVLPPSSPIFLDNSIFREQLNLLLFELGIL
ncbi:AAA family ATPase [Lyngbya sp. PCC 8106]|uniref:nucleotide-binding protein n=1 Tax=Lyngbya sp. (strain PCC 8106) TaxID=313612 RepID=UPI0000EA9C4B|nr:AAA family ATPase [Lyngbya sp. PCC 8106]EAW33315.1 hypothetical protein L8106_09161 [Lyngbya sp. PCC 8106]